MRPYLILLILLSSIYTATAQKVYKLRYSTEVTLNTIGLGSLITGFVLDKKSDPPTLASLQNLNRNDIWKLDRGATYNWSTGSATASDVLVWSSVAMPAFLLFNKNVRKEHYTAVLYLETLLLTQGVTYLTKTVVQRKRPLVYNPNVPSEEKTKKSSLQSFFSGHTSTTAAASFFMATVFADMNPESKLKPLFWTIAATLPAAVGVLRYTAGKHYPTDIFVGYVTGAALGYLVPHVHKICSKKKNNTATPSRL